MGWQIGRGDSPLECKIDVASFMGAIAVRPMRAAPLTISRTALCSRHAYRPES